MEIFNKKLKFLLPILFIIIYGSGFVATKYGLAHITPLAFLILFLIILFLKSSWPTIYHF